MSESRKPEAGSVGWFDLTVGDAETVRDFYTAVVGWESSAVSMGDYEDYTMSIPQGPAVGGVCHARGTNADLPAQWLVYITVADLDASMARCRELGGRVIAGPKNLGSFGRSCVIQDPAGAVAALIQPAQ